MRAAVAKLGPLAECHFAARHPGACELTRSRGAGEDARRAAARTARSGSTGRREGGKGQNAIFVRKTERKFVASGHSLGRSAQLDSESSRLAVAHPKVFPP